MSAKLTGTNALFAIVGFLPGVSDVITEDAKLVASDASPDAWFGYSVAVDGHLAVVGARIDDAAGLNSGSAYVFSRCGNGWIQEAKLLGADTSPGDSFGYAVAISNDTIVVTAPFDDDAGNASGSAYVFVRSDDSWEQEQKLVAGDGDVLDQFGFSAALDADTAVIGAAFDDDLGPESGSAYVFERSGSSWSQTAKLLAGDGETEAEFGRSASIDGDTIVLGAPLATHGTTRPGAAYVFVRAGPSWIQEAKLAPDDGSNQSCGKSVSISGDTVLAGAPDDNAVAICSGSAYVFTRNDGAWTQEAKLVASDGETFDELGEAVANRGDEVFVGAPNANRVYVFEKNGSWIEKAQLVGSDTAPLDAFGWSVAAEGNTTLVGAFSDDDAGGRSGSAFVFDAEPVLSLVAEPEELSLSSGGTQTLTIDRSGCPGDTFYKILGSTSGTSPGLDLGPHLLPLNPDHYFWFTVETSSKPPLSDFQGSIETGGIATAFFTLPPGTDPSLAGLTLHHAFVITGPRMAGLRFVSNATPLSLVP